jgi:hypothetical protein
LLGASKVLVQKPVYCIPPSLFIRENKSSRKPRLTTTVSFLSHFCDNSIGEGNSKQQAASKQESGTRKQAEVGL